jgi:hypothetical protein
VTRKVVGGLASIGRLAICSVCDHVAPLHFPEVTSAHRAVAKWNGASFVDVHCPSLNATNLVTLRPKGLELLVAAGHDADAYHLVRRPGAGTTHLLRCNDVRVALAVHARRRSDVRVVQVVSDLDVRRWLGAESRRRDALIPDLLVRLDVGGRELRLLVEVDLQSEASRVWAEKVRAIHERYRLGAAIAGFEPPWRPVLLAPRGRVERLAKVTAAEGGAALWVAGELDRFIADPFGPVLATAEDIANASGEVVYDLALAPASTPALTPASTAKAGAR